MFAKAIRRPFELKGNNRGAIMVLGVFFACMMIGWMWMMIGLGDAIVWRDRSQEAADSMAYSSAAIQAQGMNLISFVNVLMLILTAVYLVMSFVYDILDFLHTMIGSTNDGSCLPTSCDVRKDDLTILSMVPYLEWLEPIADVWCDVGQFVGALHDGNTNDGPPGGVGGIFGKYEKVMVKVMPPLSTFEDFVSYATPWAGELVGIYQATQYKDYGKMRLGLPISATLITIPMKGRNTAKINPSTGPAASITALGALIYRVPASPGSAPACSRSTRSPFIMFQYVPAVAFCPPLVIISIPSLWVFLSLLM